MLLKAKDVTIRAGAKTLIEIQDLEIYDGDRIGLVGKNGAGKTTLLKTLAGLLPLESGAIERFGKIEYLPQLKEQEADKSGGEITQQFIQRAFSKQAGILFADEPTTHLDIQHIEWVENSLQHWKGAYVVVSHDRAFLDRVCHKIWEIDEQKLRVFKGNYEQYSEQKKKQQREHEQAYKKYTLKQQQLKKALQQKKEKAKRAAKKPKQVSASDAKITGAKPYFAKKQKKLDKAAKTIETRLQQLEKVEKPYEEKPLKMTLPFQEQLHNKTVIQVNRLEGKIAGQRLWEKASFFIKGGDKVAIIGPNGSGKTTLLNHILDRADGVSVSSACRFGYFKQDLSILDEDKTILENVKKDSYYDETFIRIVLARLKFKKDDVFKKIRLLSGGERVKVALAKLFVSGHNILVLDEPTNFLDLEAVEALENLLMEYEGTLLFVSHDRRFVEKIAAKIIVIENQQLQFFDGTYKEYMMQAERQREKDERKEKLLLLETKMSDVLSRLSLEPSDELEKQFEQLLQEKQKLLDEG